MSNYVKKFERGEMYLDLPQANCIYELPLLSFSDLKGGVNLSLVFNQALRFQGNIFNIDTNYKLNLEKRLVVGNTTYYIEANGKRTQLTVNGSGNSIRYTFPDDSGRIIRKTFDKQNQATGYQLEYPDFSYELYNTDGSITSVYDKYGDKVLKYTYAAGGAVASIGFRITKDENDNDNEVAAKTLDFTYTGNQLLSISFSGDSSATIGFEYAYPQVTVKHYSGVVYKLESPSENFSAKVFESENATVPTYSKNCEKSGSLVTLSDKENNVQIQQTQYFFGDDNYVEITDNQGVRTRVQFDGDKAMYAYEIGETDAVFDNLGDYTGKISVFRVKNDAEQDAATSYVQKMYDGKECVKNGNTWNLDIVGNFSGQEGDCIVSGWIKSKEDHLGPYSLGNLRITAGTYDKTHALGTVEEKKWFYFAYKFPIKGASLLQLVFDYEAWLEIKDLRVICRYSHVKPKDEETYFPLQEELLIHPTEGHVFFLKDVSFLINGYSIGDGKPAFEDLLRYKLHSEKNEFYYNHSKAVVPNVSSVQFLHNNIPYDLSAFRLCKRGYQNKGILRTYYYDHSGGDLLQMNTYDAEDVLVTATDYDAYMDVTTAVQDGITTLYTRENGLLTYAHYGTYQERFSYDQNQGTVTVTNVSEETTTTYHYNTAWGFLQSVTLPDGSVIQHTYDGDAPITTKFGDGETDPTHTFGYTNGHLSSIVASNHIVDANNNVASNVNMRYDFTYSRGDLVCVSKNGSVIEQHTHAPTATTSYYPNSTSPLYSISRTYDKYGRLLSIDSDTLQCVYDVFPTFDSETGEFQSRADSDSAKLAMTVDNMAHEIARYQYTLNGFLWRKTVTANDDFSDEKTLEEFTYDEEKNRLTSKTFTRLENELSKIQETFAYQESFSSNNRVASIHLDIDDAPMLDIDFQYDAFNRLQHKQYDWGDSTITKTFTYANNKITKVEDKKGGVVLASNEYTYDALGRIVGDTRISSGTTAGQTVTYTYNVLGQLVRENNPLLDKTFVFCYDGIGNISSIATHDYTTGELGTVISTQSFSYDTTHKDRLTAFGNKAITYNANGEMTSFDGWDYSWSKGRLTTIRQITTAASRAIVKPGLPTSSKTHSFTYNAFGQRTMAQYSYFVSSTSSTPIGWGETVNYTKKFFYDHAGRLMFETKTTTLQGTGEEYYEIAYLYDQSSMVGMELTKNNQSTLYYFQRNLLGDVVAIYDTNGTLKVRYIYDAWGNCTIANGSDMQLAIANPIRYRGYYYDQDTGLYYLNARYYSPELRRFISPDDTAYLDPENANGLNLYAYCYNDPVKLHLDLGIQENNIALSHSANNNVSSNIGTTIFANSKKNRLFGYELRTSAGWESSTNMLVGYLGRIGFSSYTTKTKGQTGIIYVFAGKTTDMMNALEATYYAGFGINLFGIIGMEWQVEALGVGYQFSLGSWSVAYNANLIGGTSFTIGKNEDLGDGYTETRGFTIGVNTFALITVLTFVYYAITTGDLSILYEILFKRKPQTI